MDKDYANIYTEINFRQPYKISIFGKIYPILFNVTPNRFKFPFKSVPLDV